MDVKFKEIWEDFQEANSNRVFTRLDKELAHRFYVLGRDGKFPDGWVPPSTQG